MRTLLLCTLLALLTSKLIASEQISVEAIFISAPWYRHIPHEMDKLTKLEGIHIDTLPTGSTHTGQATELQRTRQFLSFSMVPGHKQTSFTGCILRVTPYLQGHQLAYDAHVTVREFVGFTGTKGVQPASAFSTRELDATGTTQNGESVWLRLPKDSAGYQQIVWLRLKHDRNA